MGEPIIRAPFDQFARREIEVGRWVDGLTLYRQIATLQGNLATGVTQLVHNVAGLVRVVAASGVVRRDNGQQLILPQGTGTQAVTIAVTSTHVILNVGAFWTGAGNILSDPILIVYYTKA